MIRSLRSNPSSLPLPIVFAMVSLQVLFRFCFLDIRQHNLNILSSPLHLLAYGMSFPRMIFLLLWLFWTLFLLAHRLLIRMDVLKREDKRMHICYIEYSSLLSTQEQMLILRVFRILLFLLAMFRPLIQQMLIQEGHRLIVHWLVLLLFGRTQVLCFLLLHHQQVLPMRDLLLLLHTHLRDLPLRSFY